MGILTPLKSVVEVSGSYTPLWPYGDVLFEDRFHRDLCGWTWLMDDTTPKRGPVWSSRRGNQDGGALLLQTGDVFEADADGEGTATAIKRLILPKKEDGSYEQYIDFEARFGWASPDADNPRYIQFGIDTQRADIGTRRQYYKARFLNYDDSGGSRVNQWQVLTSGGASDVTGATMPYWNEAKAGSHHVRLRVDIVNEAYVYLWVNGERFDLSGFSAPADGNVTNFDDGLNASVDLFNRLNTATERQSLVHVDYARMAVAS